MFSKLSQTRYDVGDLETRLVCAVSAEHNENVAIPYFWFGVDRNMVEFLEAAPSSWFCFGCGSARFTLLVPLLSIKPYLAKMSVTSGKHRWHIVIQKKDERFVLQLPESAEGPDLTKFLISGSKV